MKKIGLMVGLLAIGILIAYQTGWITRLQNVGEMQQWFQSLGFAGYFAFILLSVAVAVFMLPGQLLAIIAGISYGGFIGGWLTVIGATLGSTLSFVIAKYFARDYVVERFGKSNTFQKIEAGVKENGVEFLILTRLVPVFPYAIQSYAYALTPMTAGKFTIVSFFTMLPASFIYAYLASDIAVYGFSKALLVKFAIFGVLLFLLTYLPKRYAKKHKITLKKEKS